MEKLSKKKRNYFLVNVVFNFYNSKTINFKYLPYFHSAI